MRESSNPNRTRRSQGGQERDERKGKWQTAMGGAGPYLGLGMQIALTMAFYVGVGIGLDYWIGTLPLLTIVGALVGLGTVLYQVTRVAEALGKGREQRDRDEPSKGT